MREYTIAKHVITRSHTKKTFDKWVVVKIYKKRGTSNSADENMKDENAIHGIEQPIIIDAPQFPPPLAHGAPIYHDPLFNGAPQSQNNQTHLPAPQVIQPVDPISALLDCCGYLTNTGLQIDPNCYGSSNVSSFNSQQTQQQPEKSGLMIGFETIAPFGYGLGYSSAADQNGLHMDQLLFDGPGANNQVDPSNSLYSNQQNGQLLTAESNFAAHGF